MTRGALTPSPGWVVRREGALLVVAAGDDERYALDTDDATADALLRAWSAGALAPARLPPAAAALCEQLLLLGAATPGLAGDVRCGAIRPQVHCVVVGAPFVDAAIGDAVGAALRDNLRNDVDLVDDARHAATTVVLRVGGGYDELLAATDGIDHPHLLVDATFHHTVCVGPIVLPGVTACLACLVQRLRERWGDTDVAPRPAAAHHAALLAGLAVQALDAYLSGAPSLAGRVMRLDLHAWAARTDPLVRSVGCPRCRRHGGDA